MHSANFPVWDRAIGKDKMTSPNESAMSFCNQNLRFTPHLPDFLNKGWLTKVSVQFYMYYQSFIHICSIIFLHYCKATQFMNIYLQRKNKLL